MTEENALVVILREEFRNLHKNVQELNIGLARMEERLLRAYDAETHIEDLRSQLGSIDRRLVKLNGINGNNGQMSSIERAVAENEKKIDSLMLSRATLAGYMLAAGGTAATLVKLIF